ncbi:NADPH-dependent F420 reductase [Streptomyces sp. NBC_01465]|uniref:NADPH-dependent F420 reductase n=1 Tax=Streptomyces sp. NBC_01465 TaxID=2903878 RepID=UPI002E346327|nr:NAD(P)-binding domain-containing protein [Streptomyces sp. NBC_01465]
MRIGILGTGNMADALATHWVRAGHDVLIGGRSPDRTAATAARTGARPGTLAEAAAFGDATLLAVPHEAVPDILLTAGELRGRTLIDCTNAIGPALTLTAPAAARALADATGAHVVKAFNHCSDDIWRRPPPGLAVPLCGDDEGALATVRTLVRDLGCEPLDIGGLERAELLEATTALLIGLWKSGKDPRTMLPPAPVA